MKPIAILFDENIPLVNLELSESPRLKNKGLPKGYRSAYARMSGLTLTSSITAQIKQVFERLGAVIVTSQGKVRFLTQKAEQLLQKYFAVYSPHSLPELLQHWFQHQIQSGIFEKPASSSDLTLRIEQQSQQLLVRLIYNPLTQQYLLLLEEQELPSFSISSLELLGLTKREAEVLFLVAQDQSNAAIAKSLGCCPGTVRKHLEHIHSKLGVQTRTAAVMVALEKLGLLNRQFVAIL